MSGRAPLDGMIPGGEQRGHTHPGSGLQVILKSIKHVTHPDLLKRPYHFQVAPLDEFGWDATAEWTDYTTVRGGTYSRPGGRGLRQIPLSSMVLEDNPTWAVYAGGNQHDPSVEPGGAAPDPLRVAWELDELCNAMSPFRLTVWNKGFRDHPELNLAVTLRSFSVRERAGEMDARYFELTFSEYRSAKLRHRGYGGGKRNLPTTVRVDKDGVAQEWRNGQAGVKVGTASSPCTMKKLAVFYYGENSMWRALAAYNGLPGFGGEESFAHLPRNGRQYRTLQIPSKDVFNIGISRAKAVVS